VVATTIADYRYPAWLDIKKNLRRITSLTYMMHSNMLCAAEEKVVH
jgi:hypothetical protein